MCLRCFLKCFYRRVINYLGISGSGGEARFFGPAARVAICAIPSVPSGFFI